MFVDYENMRITPVNYFKPVSRGNLENLKLYLNHQEKVYVTNSLTIKEINVNQNKSFTSFNFILTKIFAKIFYIYIYFLVQF